MSAEVFWIVFPHWIRAFVFTLIVEVPVFVIIAKVGRRKSDCAPLWRLALAGAAGTVLTHPLLWFVWPRVVSDYTMYVVSGELLVATVETFVFWGLARPITLTRAACASVAANSASFGVGLIVGYLGWMQ